MDAIKYLKSKRLMCDYISNFDGCTSCPIFLLMKEHGRENEECVDIDTDYPDEAIAAVNAWLQQYNKYPTWNELLQYIFSYTFDLNSEDFIKWLDTEISENIAQKYNIPYKRELYRE